MKKIAKVYLAATATKENPKCRSTTQRERDEGIAGIFESKAKR